MGLLGSTHCVAMCGGVVAMTCSALPLSRRGRPLAQLPYVLAYNAGRIASYAVAGAVTGAVLDTESSWSAAHARELDEEIGVSGGDLGAPNLAHPPAAVGGYGEASAGVSSPTEEAPAEGPIQPLEE